MITTTRDYSRVLTPIGVVTFLVFTTIGTAAYASSHIADGTLFGEERGNVYEDNDPGGELCIGVEESWFDLQADDTSTGSVDSQFSATDNQAAVYEGTFDVWYVNKNKYYINSDGTFTGRGEQDPWACENLDWIETEEFYIHESGSIHLPGQPGEACTADGAFKRDSSQQDNYEIEWTLDQDCFVDDGQEVGKAEAGTEFHAIGKMDPCINGCDPRQIDVDYKQFEGN